MMISEHLGCVLCEEHGGKDSRQRWACVSLGSLGGNWVPHCQCWGMEPDRTLYEIDSSLMRLIQMRNEFGGGAGEMVQ